jgi:hypothetical protein
MLSARLSRVLLACLALTLPAAWTDQSMAQGRATAARKAPKLDVKALEAQLKARDRQAMLDALSAARDAPQQAAPLAPAIEQTLRDGVPQDVALAALQTLGAIGLESSSKTLSVSAHHRDPKVRKAAARALERTKGAEAIATLRRCMSDADPGVRGVAASGLGNLGARQYVPDLFVALDHKVAEAAGAIGQLCNPGQCDQLLGKLGRLSFDIVSPGLDQILFRNGDELGEEFKIKVVGRVREMGTQEANRLLKDVQSRWPAKGSKKIKQAIDQAVIATEGGAGSRPEGSTP